MCGLLPGLTEETMDATYRRISAWGFRGHWLHRTRTFIGRRMLRLGFRCADVATFMAPWVDE